MKVLFAVITLHLLSALPALADAPPAILGAIDSKDIQSLSNPEEVRGERFDYDTLLLGPLPTFNSVILRAAFFCLQNGRCTGQTGGVAENIGVTQVRWVGFYSVAYRTQNNSLAWKSY